MKFNSIIAVLIGIITIGNAQNTKQNVEITSYSLLPNEEGGWNMEFTQSDGTERKEYGRLVNAGDGSEPYYIIDGSYTYFGPDGQLYQAKYIADQNGFRVRGTHLVPAADVKVKSVDEEDEDDLPPPAALPPSAVLSLVG